MYSVEILARGNAPTNCSSAAEAMAVVNRLRSQRIEAFVILDGDGAPVSERQLAMVVMQGRLLADRSNQTDICPAFRRGA